jgi:hypothetical protein
LQQDKRDIYQEKILSTSWLAELAEHCVYGVESRINLFSDLKVEEKQKVSGWIQTGSTVSQIENTIQQEGR